MKTANVAKAVMMKAAAWINAHKAISLGVLLAIFIAFPLVIKDNFFVGIATKTLLFMLMSTALNITNGYSGQFNIGFAGFMCVGAYSAAVLMTKGGLGFLSAMLFSGCITALVGLVISLPTSRLSGMYLSLVTLGFAEVIRIIALNFKSLTGGPLGIKNIPNPVLFGYELKGTLQLYYLMLCLLIASVFCCYRIVHSRVGRAWIAIRENPDAASSLGINLVRYKAMNFMTSAFFAGVAGTFMASYYRFINSEMFMLDFGHEVLVMVVLGGMGTFVGPILGALSINCMMEVFRFASDYRMLIYSVLIIAIMWFRPQGIAGASNSMLATRRSSYRKKKKKAVVLGGERI